MNSLPIIITVLVANPIVPQSGSLRDLERTCVRVTDDPRPDNIALLQPLTASETGARLSFAKGCRFLAEGKFGLAGAEFERAARAEPNEAIYHFWFGRATGEQASRANPIRQPGLARRTKGEFERAIALDSAYVPAREGLLRYYLAAPGFLGGSIENARAQAGEIAKLSPYRGGMAHATLAIAAKDTAALIRVHVGLAEQFPDSAAPYLSLLSIQVVRKQWAQAWSATDRLQRAAPELPVVRYAIGRAASESGEQLDRGESALREYLKHTPRPNEPSLAAAHWRLGMIAEKRGHTTAAREEYQTAVALDPKLRAAKEALARLK